MNLPLYFLCGAVSFAVGFFVSKVREKKYTFGAGYEAGIKDGYARCESDREDERTQAYIEARTKGQPYLRVVKSCDDSRK